MPKIVDHDQYRKELLSNCFDLFAEKGYAAITMRQIAQELGVSTGTLYHYFPSKEVLFEQMVEELSKVGIQKFAIEVEAATTLEERLDIGFDYVVRNEAEFIKESLIWIEFFQQQGHDAMQRSDVLKRVCQRTQQELAKLLDIDDPQLIILLMSSIDGLMLARMYNGDAISLKDQCSLLKRMIIAYQNATAQNAPSQLPS